MNRLTRITAILIQLQSKRIVTAKNIAERFEVSLRTVYRDIKTLQDAGVPIGSENGVGYFLVDGYSLPPISFTEEEANTLIILEQLIQQQGDLSLLKNFDSLLIKLKASLKNFQKETIEHLELRTQSFTKKTVLKSNWLSEIQKAITHQTLVHINYLSIYKGENTSRTIVPLAVYFTNNTWITIAYCQLRQAIREFRLDKIKTLRNTNKSFQPMAFNLQDYFKNFSN